MDVKLGSEKDGQGKRHQYSMILHRQHGVSGILTRFVNEVEVILSAALVSTRSHAIVVGNKATTRPSSGGLQHTFMLDDKEGGQHDAHRNFSQALARGYYCLH